MSLRHLTVTAMAVGLLALTPSIARADITGFVGTISAPTGRIVLGAAANMSFLKLIRIEFEVAKSSQDLTAGTPGLTTGMATAGVRIPAGRVAVNAQVGVGLYRQTLASLSSTGFATSIGAGVQIRLVGPLGVRVDYRIISLKSPMPSTSSRAPRAYVGLNLAI